jgi:hypothetical protein
MTLESVAAAAINTKKKTQREQEMALSPRFGEKSSEEETPQVWVEESKFEDVPVEDRLWLSESTDSESSMTVLCFSTSSGLDSSWGAMLANIALFDSVVRFCLGKIVLGKLFCKNFVDSLEATTEWSEFDCVAF